MFSHLDSGFPGSEHIWIRPQTGDVCFGHAGPSLPNHHQFPLGRHLISSYLRHLERSPLPLGTYNNSALFDSLVQNATSDFVLSALSRQYTWPYPGEVDCCQHILHVHSCLHQRPVAKFPETTLTFTFDGISYDPHHLESETADTRVMEDGRIRLTIANHSNIGHVFLTFHFRQDRTLYSSCEAWLCQATHVFHVLGIPREEWEGFAVLPNDYFILTLKPFNHAQSRRNCDYRFDPPYYLFVLPPPQLPDMTPDIVSWILAPAESLYYWSIDHDGNSRISEANHMALGLPCFHNHSATLPCGWKAEIYDLVRQWQVAKGFDPTTTDFARSMGHPIVEILPQDNNRFDTDVENGKDTGPESPIFSFFHTNHLRGAIFVDAKYEQEPEPMQVDEAFGSIPDPKDPSLPRQESEGRTSMDVDMEVCSNRMASLCVEAMLVDE
ncbi:hypothetical protein PQX77_006082 [Marasmius sp. AFHP31]|nr:hypothetical protein PQX77_006082 [Marasmius sp. AFHP31]